MDRRKFVKILGAGAAATTIPWRFDLKRGLRLNEALAFAQSPGLTKFKDPMPQFITDIPLATGVPGGLYGATHYSINIGQYKQVLHTDFIDTTAAAYIPGFGGTILQGYGQGGAFTHLGAPILAARSEAVQITFTNQLTRQKIIPVDATLPGPNQQLNRAAVHLHGGFIPWISDGGPHDWFDPNGYAGLSFPNGPGSVLDPGGMVAGQASYYYGNDQSARLMWYHDHAWGITRTNAYSGIATGYLITDAVEQSLISTPGPGYKGLLNGLSLGNVMVIQDKIFTASNILTIDPTWINVVTDPGPGNLWYAHVYDPTRWKLNKNSKSPLTPLDPSCIPEFFGDTMLMNGHVSPHMDVPPQRVRFRLLNACQARFVNLQLFIKDASLDGITMNLKTLLPTNPVGPPMVQIGTECGFLPAPVVFNPLTPATGAFNPVTFNGNLVLAPAERADFIIDFNGLAGKSVILYTDAPAPFPIGDPRNDYFPGAPKNPTITTPGMTPNTRQIMEFRVGTGAGDTVGFTTFVQNLNAQWTNVFNDSHPGEPLLFTPIVTAPLAPAAIPAAKRILTLNEGFDTYGRLIQTIGTNLPGPTGALGMAYMDPATEIIPRDTTEVWQICNLTGDTHPLHFHLVNLQIIARQPFNVRNFKTVPALTGVPRGPDPNEAGWKETIRMNPGEVIWVIAKFTLPTVPFTVPTSNRTGGNEYVYHCHILEHEEHDMMRPLVVT